MKIIISHDVDHLYPSDHISRDLIFPKLWVRSFLQLLKGDISFSSFFWRLASIFDKRLNQIPEVIDFDKTMGVKSTFFFGMASILGMSYRKEKADNWIKYVLKQGFDVGVHGVEIDQEDKMKQEYLNFQKISGLEHFGIRTHYVRYNNSTFHKMNHIGYLYDTSEFDKQSIWLKKEYKVGDMWEFPLHIMDGYIMKGGLKRAQEDTIIALIKAQKMGINYFTFLFHDSMYNIKTYPQYKVYYEWFVGYCKDQEYEFVSYLDAISELK